MASEASTPTVGVCLAGAVRSILSLPVVSSYHRHVVAALTRVDTHLAVVYNARSPADLSERLSTAYAPRSLALIAESETEAVVASLSEQCRVANSTRWANARGDVSVLLQWVAIGRCFEACKVAEQRRGTRYDWLIRLRTDIAFFADIPPLASLSPASAG